MKRNILFIVLLVLIIAVGMTGMDFTEKYFGYTGTEASVVKKTSEMKRGVYLSAVDKVPFDPRTISGKDGQIAPTDPTVIQNFGNCTSVEIFNYLLKELSRYDEKAAYASGGDAEVLYDGKQFIYTYGYPYLNADGEQRYADMIYDTCNQNICYLNYYDGKEYTPSLTELENATEKFKKMFDQFHKEVTDYVNARIEMGVYDSFEVYDFESLNDIDGIYKAFLKNYEYDTSGLSAIGKMLIGISQCDDVLFKYDINEGEMICGEISGYESDFTSNISTGSQIALAFYYNNMLAYSTENKEPAYSVYKGRIYLRCENFDYGYDMTLIYNPTTDTLEGFFVDEFDNI